MLFSPVFGKGPEPSPWASPRCVMDVLLPGGGMVKEVPTIQGLECVFANVVSIAVVLAGLALFVMLVIGGFKYLTSGGDPKATEQAQKTMTYAIFGLVVMIAAYLILRFLAIFTGIPELLKFIIPGPE